MNPVEMRDAADWNAPGLQNWDGPVQGYPNRQPPWPPAAFRKFRRVMRTSVQREPEWAELCREIDVENLAARAEDVPGFITARERLGHKDGGVYVSLDGWPEVEAHLRAAGIGPHRVRVRIARWRVPPERIVLPGWGEVWAHQFENDPALGIDRSMVFGKQDFFHEPDFAEQLPAGTP